MKRSILVSLMIIGAVAALVSGATFSVFTDTETATGTITAGNVDVNLDGAATLVFDPTVDCGAVIGSTTVCTEIITVNYIGTLLASLGMTLDWTPTAAPECFAVDLDWLGASTDSDSDSGKGGALAVADTTAESGTVTVTVQIDPLLTGVDLDDCQNATTGTMTLTVVATETT